MTSNNAVQEVYEKYGAHKLSSKTKAELLKKYGKEWPIIWDEVQKLAREKKKKSGSQYGKLLIVDGERIRPNMPEDKIAGSLLKKFRTPEVMRANSPWLTEYFGADLYEEILNKAEELSSTCTVSQGQNLKTSEATAQKNEYLFCNVKVKGIKTIKSKTYYVIDFKNGDTITEELVVALPYDNSRHESISISFDGETIRVDEYWAYKNLYKVGSDYSFTVESVKKYGKTKFILYLIDRNGNAQECISPTRFSKGDCIICTVMNYRKRSGHTMCLVLENPRIARSAPPDTPNYSRKETDSKQHKWHNKLKPYDKHICGKSETCACCKREFQSRHGYRFEGIEIYICTECYKEIFPKSTNPKKWVHIIYTNMGHKR